MRPTFLQWIAYRCQDSKAKGHWHGHTSCPSVHSSGPLVNTGSSAHSQTPHTVEICRPFHSQQRESERLRTWRNLPEMNRSWSPMLHRGQMPAETNEWIKTKWKSEWIHVCGKKNQWMDMWMSKRIRTWGDPLSPRGYSRWPGGTIAGSGPGKLPHSLYKHFLFPWQAWPALWKDI